MTVSGRCHAEPFSANVRTLAALFLFLSTSARAAEGFEVKSIPLTPAQEERAQRVGRQIRCAVCQGMSAADSPAEMAHAMMSRVRELVAQGKTDQEILDHFAERYGEWVLLEPRPRSNWFVWFFPAFVLFVGGGIVFGRVRRRPAAAASGTTSSATGAASAPKGSGDKYRDSIRAEVDS
jgi:cytochrome c-type biogenesis protein CcmH